METCAFPLFHSHTSHNFLSTSVLFRNLCLPNCNSSNVRTVLFYLIISKYLVHLILDISNPVLSVISITHGMELKVCLQFGSKSLVKESMCETSIYL